MTDPGPDPRTLEGDSDELALANADARPAVSRRDAHLPPAAVAVIVGMLGLAAFAWMNSRRAVDESATLARPSAGTIAVPPPEPFPQAAISNAPPIGASYAIPGPQFTVDNSLPAQPRDFAIPNPALPSAYVDSSDRRRAPMLVVDLNPAGGPEQPAAPPTAGGVARAGAAGVGQGTDPAAGAKTDLGAEERFAERVATGDPERVRATTMKSLDLTVPQGAIIPGVLETAINSDLPGFARAVVSRDVLGFDGTKVLIPRGSRLIGQYKSGLALGQSRVFVIWTRVIRADGVSVQIGSPGADALGRGGLAGEVDRHFFTRFGGSILLSVLNAGLAALTLERSGSQIYIGSPADASSVAAIALQKDQGAPPTVKAPQGSPIRIFVARDLDFSGVQTVPAQ